MLGGQGGAAVRDDDDATYDDGRRTDRRREIRYYQHAGSGADQVLASSCTLMR